MSVEIEEITYSTRPNVHWYGVYIENPVHNSETFNAIMKFLDDKSVMHGRDVVIHVWIFSDRNIIPENFDDNNWSTPESRRKCFAHATQLPNGKLYMSYDMFAEYMDKDYEIKSD